MSQAQPDVSVTVPSTIVGQWFLPNLEPYQYTSPQLQYTSNSMTDQGLWMSQPSVTQPLAPLTITEPTYFPNHVLGTEGASGPTMAYPRSMGPQHQYPAHAPYPPSVRERGSLLMTSYPMSNSPRNARNIHGVRETGRRDEEEQEPARPRQRRPSIRCDNIPDYGDGRYRTQRKS
uniref:Uncharacterized protein n=1 Tax=Homalodisca liturata TaxID=320908 RepID=A0A1B6K3U9_9HEMI